jgi:hypothetical protein
LHDALHLGTLLMEWEVEHHWGRGIDLYSDRQTWAHHQNKERIESARRARSRRSSARFRTRSDTRAPSGRN